MNKTPQSYDGPIERAPRWVLQFIAPWYRRALMAPLTTYLIGISGVVVNAKVSYPIAFLTLPAYLLMFTAANRMYQVWLIGELDRKRKEPQSNPALPLALPPGV